ncbi:MAG: TPM domain-containing protein [Candidatus Rokubacteria bacterium]|nr:TPM domain-containing protein [Candidatus Rokubacteria bacterium]
MTRHPRWIRRLLSDEHLDAIARAIQSAERRTSGEIRVHLERRVPRRRWREPADPLARARDVFARLGMHRTRERNSVLIYLAVRDRRLAIVGDEGIHARVGDDHWASVRDLMVEQLRSQRPREALLAAIAQTADVLQQHFPRRPDDTDELSDRVSTA